MSRTRTMRRRVGMRYGGRVKSLEGDASRTIQAKVFVLYESPIFQREDIL